MESLATTLAGVPALLGFTATPEHAAARGTVLLLHGLGGRKENHGPELLSLAARGFLAVGLDAVGHGERRWPDFDDRFALPRERQDVAFTEAVRATAGEVPGVVDELVHRGWAAALQVGLVGVSMGGFAGSRAVQLERRIAAAAMLVASPRWPAPDPASPHLHPERFFPVALLSQSARDDEVVPAGQARELHAALAPLYAEAPERLAYVEHAGPHMLPEDGWGEAWERAVAWLDRFVGRRSGY